MVVSKEDLASAEDVRPPRTKADHGIEVDRSAGRTEGRVVNGSDEKESTGAGDGLDDKEWKRQAAVSPNSPTGASLAQWTGRRGKPPWGMKWRSSAWYITTVVALGVATDALAYQIVVPVLPYHLQDLGYSDISTLTSWLLFAYSAGIFVSIFPVAYFFNKYPFRRGPLIVAVLFLEGALVLFMLVQPYWVMVLSRFIQGAASAVVWSVGFALICENVDEKNIGRQIGFATSGVSVGATAAPPIGGVLYWKFGWQAPFIFTIAACGFDLFLRLFVLEQKDLKEWTIPAIAKAEEPKENATGRRSTEIGEREAIGGQREGTPESSSSVSRAGSPVIAGREQSPRAQRETPVVEGSPQVSATVQTVDKRDLPPWGVLLALVKSKRGMTGFILTFVFGSVIAALDATLTLRIEGVWQKESDFVGLMYLAASAPTFLTGPIVGALADKWGSEYLITPALLLTLPWLPLMTLTSSLPGFVVYFAFINLFLSCAMAPVGLEITMAARESEGMSEIHQFAAMNISFAVSTAIGAVAGGQMYDRVTDGWGAVLWFSFGVTLAGVPVGFAWAGNDPLLDRLMRRLRSGQAKKPTVEVDAGTSRAEPTSADPSTASTIGWTASEGEGS